MRKVLIVEDDKLEIEALEKVLHKIDADIQVFATDNLGDAFQYAIRYSISVFIVDIILNPESRTDMSGLEFVESIRKLPQYKSSPVIFITGLNAPRLYAYEDLHCYKYIQKPLFYTEVEEIVREALELNLTSEADSPLKIKKEGILYIIRKKDIICAISKMAKMTIVTQKENYNFYYLTCKTLLDMLQSDHFVQCSRSTIVNRNYIRAIDKRKDLIELRGYGEKMKIGMQFKKNFEGKL